MKSVSMMLESLMGWDLGQIKKGETTHDVSTEGEFDKAYGCTRLSN